MLRFFLIPCHVFMEKTMVTQSASQAADNCSFREEKVTERLRELYSALDGIALKDDVWNRLLTDEERTRWDSKNAAMRECHNATVLYGEAKGISLEASVIEIWRNYNLADIDYNWLCRELFHFTGERVGPLAVETDSSNFTTVSDKPEWDPDRNELWFRGRCVRTVRGRTVATNIHVILDVFHEDGWPTRIDDPLPNGPNHGRLRSTVATLNEELSGMVFLSDGTGEGIRWEPRFVPIDAEVKFPVNPE